MAHTRNLILRVYGLIINNNDEILVTDEFQLGQRMTKFPGGGWQFGEGLVDCLIREIKEECNGQVLKNIAHYYTTGFYQKALFFPNHQLISVYYTAKLSGEPVFTISNKAFAYNFEENGSQSFRWVKINDLNSVEFSFPIDKFVAEKLQQKQKPSV